MAKSVPIQLLKNIDITPAKLYSSEDNRIEKERIYAIRLWRYPKRLYNKKNGYLENHRRFKIHSRFIQNAATSRVFGVELIRLDLSIPPAPP